MNRRTFLAQTAPTVAGRSRIGTTGVEARPGISSDTGESPTTARVAAGIERYAGAWGFDQIAHLLRRTMFGARKQDIDALNGLSMDAAVAMLLADAPAPPAPPDYNANTDPSTWTTDSFNSSKDGLYFTYTLSWWIGLMLKQDISVREKMTLFWHNHFVSTNLSVKDARYMYRQNVLFRQFALGNVRELTRQVTLDPAMLRYLNGATNKKGSPNENYARELQELFTIGKGPEISPGNYTNYTEDDIKAAARVLTGWSDDSKKIAAKFTASSHDTTDKQFSPAYGNHIVQGQSGEDGARSELDDLLGMIFDQAATARYICRKLYRWFVYYEIDQATETSVIEPLAEILRTNAFEIRPVLDALFKSAHFHDPANRGCLIKTPLDLVIGAIRFYTIPNIVPPELNKSNWAWRTLRRTAATMQMDLMNHPNVAGWPEYWQEPTYHELWINADTLQKRIKFTDDLTVNGFQLDEAYGKEYIDPLEVESLVSDPSDPDIIIDEMARLLFPIAITDAQKRSLKAVLLPGLPDYEWAIEWSDYKNDATDEGKCKSVSDKLRALLNTMHRMAEYQLS